MYTVVAARLETNAANGADSSNRTVKGSGAVTRLRVGNSRASGEATRRSNVNLTSSATSSRPLTGGLACQRTPFFNVITYVVGVGCATDAARSGMTSPVGLYLNRRLWV